MSVQGMVSFGTPSPPHHGRSYEQEWHNVIKDPSYFLSFLLAPQRALHFGFTLDSPHPHYYPIITNIQIYENMNHQTTFGGAPSGNYQANPQSHRVYEHSGQYCPTIAPAWGMDGGNTQCLEITRFSPIYEDEIGMYEYGNPDQYSPNVVPAWGMYGDNSQRLEVDQFIPSYEDGLSGIQASHQGTPFQDLLEQPKYPYLAPNDFRRIEEMRNASMVMGMGNPGTHTLMIPSVVLGKFDTGEPPIYDNTLLLQTGPRPSLAASGRKRIGEIVDLTIDTSPTNTVTRTSIQRQIEETPSSFKDYKPRNPPEEIKRPKMVLQIPKFDYEPRFPWAELHVGDVFSVIKKAGVVAHVDTFRADREPRMRWVPWSCFEILKQGEDCACPNPRDCSCVKEGSEKGKMFRRWLKTPDWTLGQVRTKAREVFFD
ncbi:hypothetical protein BKA65DRAFT_480561 [Rhexocercosporidium sp. MPI-PUGE-AT-0058]|nr:hypothetical protein BKA65DRAFT_480561 [Rhexocercosporidium sp. MPI-PUGE-AT-0058]